MEELPRAEFLKAAQRGDAEAVAALLDAHPQLTQATSTTKGYNALHFAAMGGHVALVEYLVRHGFDVSQSSREGIAPLQVALEYKRFNTARTIQRLRDCATKERQLRADEEEPRDERQLRADEEEPRDERQPQADEEPSPPVPPSSPPPVPLSSPPPPSVPSDDAARARSLDVANREAAQQALAAGERAMRSGDLNKAVRLLGKAQALDPSDSVIAAALGEARALHREQQPSRGASSTPAPPRASPPERRTSPQETSPRQEKAATSSSAPAAESSAAPRRSAGQQLGSFANAALLAPLLALLRLFWWALVSPPLKAGGALLRAARSRWERLPPLGGDAETRDSLVYLFYYWRARLMWPMRLMGMLGAVLASWMYPWYAYAVVVLGLSAAAVFLTPMAPWSSWGIGRYRAAAIATAACSICALAPKSTAILFAVALNVAVGVLASARWAAAFAAALLVLVNFPTTCSALLALAAWGLFFVILPRICLLLTEFCVFTYFYPFGGPFAHVALICGLFALDTPKMAPGFAIFLALLYFLPRVTCGVIGILLVRLCFPLLLALRRHFASVLSRPYGPPPEKLPERVSSPKAAIAAVINAKDHYGELNSYRTATAQELKERYRRLSLYLHPDKNDEEAAAAALLKVSAAWEVLGDGKKRAEYDAGLDGFGLDEGEEMPDEPGAAAAPAAPVGAGPPGMKKRKPKPNVRPR